MSSHLQHLYLYPPSLFTLLPYHISHHSSLPMVPQYLYWNLQCLISPTTPLCLKTFCNYLILMSLNIFSISEFCQSTLVSLSSSVFLPTPPGHKDLSAKIVNAESSLLMSLKLLISQPTLIFQEVTSYLTYSLSHHHHYYYQDALTKSKSKDAFTIAILCI